MDLATKVAAGARITTPEYTPPQILTQTPRYQIPPWNPFLANTSVTSAIRSLHHFMASDINGAKSLKLIRDICETIKRELDTFIVKPLEAVAKNINLSLVELKIPH